MIAVILSRSLGYPKSIQEDEFLLPPNWKAIAGDGAGVE